MNIITTKAECQSAADQFREQWQAKLKSGFPKTDSSSNLQFRGWFNDKNSWKAVEFWTEHGFEPRFRDQAWLEGNSAAPLGCSMDRNGNMIYWNPYKMDQTQKEWEKGASYTVFGGLIHAESAASDAWVAGQIGICK